MRDEGARVSSPPTCRPSEYRATTAHTLRVVWGADRPTGGREAWYRPPLLRLLRIHMDSDRSARIRATDPGR